MMKRAAIIILTGIIVAGSAFIVNLMLYGLSIAGHTSLLTFGFQGILIFLLVFPWAWGLFALALIILASFVFLGFKLAPWRMMLTIAGVLLGIAILVGVALYAIGSFNSTLLHDADQGTLAPPFSYMYESVHAGAPHDLGVFRGIVTSIGTSAFTIAHDDFDNDTDTGSYAVIPPAGFDFASLSPGERVYAAGTPTASGIQAFGVAIIPDAP